MRVDEERGIAAVDAHAGMNKENPVVPPRFLD
jgi:hypothetical protein